MYVLLNKNPSVLLLIYVKLWSIKYVFLFKVFLYNNRNVKCDVLLMDRTQAIHMYVIWYEINVLLMHIPYMQYILT